MTNINDRDLRDEKRSKYMPMVEFCVQVAIYQLKRGRHFIMENPQSSALWWQYVFRRIIEHPQVTWDTLDMCAYGMKDPNGYCITIISPLLFYKAFQMVLLILYLKGVQTKPSGVRLTSTSSSRDQRQDMEVGPNLHRCILIVFVHSLFVV